MGSKISNLKNFYLKHRLWLNLIPITILFLLSVLWESLVFVPFLMVAFLCVFDEESNGFSYLMFSLPYLTIRTPISLILFVACCALFTIKLGVVNFLIKKKKLGILEVVFFALFCVYACLPFGEYNRNFYLKICVLIFLLILISVVTKSTGDLKFRRGIRFLAISLIVTAAFSIVKYISPNYVETFKAISRFKALFDNTNTLASVCEALLGFLILLFIKEKRWYDGVLIIMVALLGCLTFSKTYFIILAILVVLMFCFFIKSHPKQTLITLGVGLFLIIGVCLVMPKAVNYLVDRFAGLDSPDFKTFMNKITTGRYTLWTDYIDHMLQHPLGLLFGFGLGARRASFSSPHNLFISMIYQLGIVGTALFITTIMMILKKKEKNQVKAKFQLATIIPIVVLVLISCVEDTIFFIAYL